MTLLPDPVPDACTTDWCVLDDGHNGACEEGAPLVLTGTAQTRTVDLLQAVDLEAKALECANVAPGHVCDCQTATALRHLVECVSLLAQWSAPIAAMTEPYAVRAAVAMLLIEDER